MKQLTLILALALFTWTPAQAVAQGTVQWNSAALATANTSKTGTSGVVSFVYHAQEVTNYVDRLSFRAVGTNVQTVARCFLNNGGVHTDAANNVLFAEILLESTTLDEADKFADEELAMNIYIPKGYRIFCTLGTGVASGYRITCATKTPTEVAE